MGNRIKQWLRLVQLHCEMERGLSAESPLRVNSDGGSNNYFVNIVFPGVLFSLL